MSARDSDSAAHSEPVRACGACSLCCTVLRVDALGKLGGTNCVHQRPGHPEGGCGVHARRPDVCRAYRCLWQSGSFEAADRPDRLGAVLSLTTEGETPMLFVHEAHRGAYEASPRLQAIAADFRVTLPVRISAAEDVMDPDRPYRVLLPNGEDHLVTGDRITVRRPGAPDQERRMPLLDRSLRGLVLSVRRRYLAFVAAQLRIRQ